MNVTNESSQIAPTFALIDPFGFSGIPYALIQRLLSKNKCEVLVTVMVDSINRWLEHPDENITAHIVETFGTDEAIRIAERKADRVTELKNLYHRQLNKAAKFVRYFEMHDRDGRLVYYLFFASNNSLGHLKMKEAMWKVDPIDRQREEVRLIRLVYRRFATALTVVLADQTEPGLYFATAEPERVKAALGERGWRVEEQRSKLRPWVPVA